MSRDRKGSIGNNCFEAVDGSDNTSLETSVMFRLAMHEVGEVDRRGAGSAVNRVGFKKAKFPFVPHSDADVSVGAGFIPHKSFIMEGIEDVSHCEVIISISREFRTFNVGNPIFSIG